MLVVGANRYSRNNEGSRSCASCHNPGLSWADGQPRAVGLTQELLTLRCPTLLGVAWIPRPGWTGRFRDLESVAMTPITSPLRVKSRHDALKRRCPLYPVISTGRRNTGGQPAINNSDGLPNVRPIAFSESLRNQLSHNVIFSAALVPPRNLRRPVEPAPESGHSPKRSGCLLCAKRRHLRRSKMQRSIRSPRRRARAVTAARRGRAP
ncbi:MAG: cytochrome-c peroxidase [Xanthobacteraceae bacterium]